MKLIKIILALIVGSLVALNTSAQEKDPAELYAVIETDHGTLEFLL